MGSDTNVEFNDVALEYKLRIAAIEKLALLKAGSLPSFSWDDALFDVKVKFDPSQVVGEDYANYVACRLSASELLKTIAPQMHYRVDKLSKHARILIDTDSTWMLDDAWLHQHGQVTPGDAVLAGLRLELRARFRWQLL